MKKKNIIALLLIPFLIASLCIVTVKTTYHAVDIDIQSIAWEYEDYEPFKLSGNMYKLSAKGVMPNSYAVSDGNDLVWTLKDKNESSEPCAEIVFQNGNYYLKTLKEGEVVITCSNQKGTVFRSMTGIIYDKGAIILQPSIKSSQNNIGKAVEILKGELGTETEIAAKEFLNAMLKNDSLGMLTAVSKFEKNRIAADKFIKDLKYAVVQRIKKDTGSYFAKPLTEVYNLLPEYEQKLITNINLNLLFCSLTSKASQIFGGKNDRSYIG